MPIINLVSRNGEFTVSVCVLVWWRSTVGTTNIFSFPCLVKFWVYIFILSWEIVFCQKEFENNILFMFLAEIVIKNYVVWKYILKEFFWKQSSFDLFSVKIFFILIFFMYKGVWKFWDHKVLFVLLLRFFSRMQIVVVVFECFGKKVKVIFVYVMNHV